MKTALIFLFAMITCSCLPAAEMTLDDIYSKLEIIELYAAVCAIALSLGMGLVMWRLVLLSKNQRSLF